MLFSPPVGCTEVRPKSLNSLSRSVSGIPGPWSRTASTIEPATASTSTVIVEPGGENLTALLSRLSTTCRILFGSRRCGGGRSCGTISIFVRFADRLDVGEIDRLFDEVGQIGQLQGNLELTRFNCGHVEEFVDQRQHLVAGRVDGFHEVELIGCELAHDAIAQEFGQSPDGGERVAQIVCRHAKEFVLCGIRLAQFFHQELLFGQQASDLQMRADAGQRLLRPNRFG